jgi:hypothetical protein
MDMAINIVLGTFSFIMIFLAIGKFRYDTGMSKYSPYHKDK